MYAFQVVRGSMVFARMAPKMALSNFFVQSRLASTAETTKAPNAWVSHVKAYALQHGTSYRDSLKLARATYTRASVPPPAVDAPSGDGVLVIPEDDEQLDPHWRAMESRVKSRRTKKVGEGPRGRGTVRPSAWDHEHV